MNAAAQPVRQAHGGRTACAAPVPATLAGWVLLVMDGLTLALPQRDIATIELTRALQPAEPGGNEIGWLVQNAEHRPVYCLDRHFASAPMLADAARVCMLFRSEGRILGLAGARISLLAADADISVPPLPVCLARPGSPVIGLALHRDVVVTVVHAQALADYLSPLEAVHGG